MMKMEQKTMSMAAVLALMVCAGCAEKEGVEAAPERVSPGINAEMVCPETRTCVDLSGVQSGEGIHVMWEPSDELGAFTDGGSANVRYVNDMQSENVRNATFSTSASVSGDITYVYYPYDQANDGKDATALSGSLPAVQTIGGSLGGDYKYGELTERTDEGNCSFKFRNIFSMVHFKIDASGTAITGETLESVSLTVTREGVEVPLCGDFTFSAVDGSYELGATSTELVTEWNQSLEGVLTGVATVFPEVKSGDKFNFTFKTANYVANLTVTSKVDFAPGAYYTLPLILSKFSKLQTVKTGRFTAATYNVDGLPNITVNLLSLKKSN